ncbi:glycosyltransferase [Enterococcus faecium]|uniref:glycosyltransferase family 2 protein n=1 Tax=Enterococcus faecium TaxID=1352 RepID=UPI0020747107|nr:glycosyltransferase family 2 protein [Enterococcus faecium]MCM6879955.1 glycosyltransferase [Enterococcus faecium]MCU1825025.1 glycosyltransferase [Enterococcus faecium]
MKVSIVVPVYNVEKYLRKCVNSLLVQSHSDIEIILVDDGSTDKSGYICDTLALHDSRISVYHKKNSGQSDARNLGLDNANGEWITFVDSDDYVTPDYIEFLLNLAIKNQADISIATYTYITPRRRKDRGTGEMVVMDAETTIKRMLLDDGFDMGVWAKMFRKEFFNEHRFPSGKIFEDSLITYQIVANSSKIAFGSKSIYFYVNREDSTVNRQFTEKKLDLLEMTDQAVDFIIRKYPCLKLYTQRRILWSRFSTLNQIITSKNRKEYKNIALKLKNDILLNKKLVKESDIPKRDKLAYWILKYLGLSGYRICWNMYLKFTR